MNSKLINVNIKIFIANRQSFSTEHLCCKVSLLYIRWLWSLRQLQCCLWATFLPSVKKETYGNTVMFVCAGQEGGCEGAHISLYLSMCWPIFSKFGMRFRSLETTPTHSF